MWLIRRLGVTECGAFGGMGGSTDQWQRWCRKPFGHEDSCAFDPVPNSPNSQPGSELRQRAKGWTA
jgi:hypothetical protein